MVDELGSLDDAIVYAADLVEISDYRVTSYPNYKKDFEDTFKGFPFMNLKEQLIKDELGQDNFKIYKEVKNISRVKGIQARLPYEIEIK